METCKKKQTHKKVLTYYDFTSFFDSSGDFSKRQAKLETFINPKSRFFLLGLKYTLRTYLDSKKISLNHSHELSTQVRQFSVRQIGLHFQKAGWTFLKNFLTSGGQLYKGGLISDSFSLGLQSPQYAKNYPE